MSSLLRTWTLLLLFSSPLLQAGVYKWTDAQGNVHFGDHPPAGGGQEVRVKSAPSTSATTPSELERRQTRQRMLEIYQEDRVKKKQEKEKQRQAELKRNQECQRARNELDTYQNARGIYRKNKQGERYYLNEEERNAYIERLKQQVAHWCN